ncbi:hypothetical protein EYF80_052374 [Liparis tanakae]|uniref:Uncharacterized protein n=1 Tax=Liparis tanakae TaxID=230148 RepID=A0A4Z2F8I2_9TELE|nr:hypothetical protein EYF80_052374 [Liparis tanakae]
MGPIGPRGLGRVDEPTSSQRRSPELKRRPSERHRCHFQRTQAPAAQTPQMGSELRERRASVWARRPGVDSAASAAVEI